MTLLTPGAKKMLRTVLSVAAGPIGAALLAPILARALGPDGRGQMAATLAPMIFADVVAAAGLPAAVTFFRAKGVPVKKIVRAVWPIILISATIAYVLMLCLAPAISANNNIPLIFLQIIWLAVYAGAAITMLRSLRDGERDWSSMNVESILSPTLRFVACASVVALGVASPLIVSALYIGSGIAGSLVLIRGNHRRWALDVDVTRKQIASYGSKAWAASLGLAVRPRFDQLILALFAAPSVLGLYAISVTIAELPNVIYLAVTRLLFPKVASGDFRLTEAIVVVRITLLCAAIFAIVLSIIATPLLVIVFGSDFAGASQYLVILLVASVFTAGATVIASLLSAAGEPGVVSVVEGASIVITVAALLAVAPGYGATGAAVVMLVTQFGLLVARVVSLAKIGGVSPAQIIVPRMSDFAMVLSERKSTKTGNSTESGVEE